jgi:TetR/AcrR family transcriptional regulator, transcriptional repressor for nem operon
MRGSWPKEWNDSTSQAAKDLARLLLSTLLGIRVLARTRSERKLLEGLIRPVFALLNNPLHLS